MLIGYGYVRKPQWSVALFSRKIANQLTKLGCIPAKSLTLKFPTEEQVPKNLLRHWLRGMWDGDGSFSHWKYYNEKRKYHGISFDASFVGTLDVCIGIKQFIEENIDIRCDIKKIKNKEVKRLKIVGGIQNIYKFMVWLYQDSTIWMNRKYNKCKEMESFMSEKFDTLNFFKDT
jgi:hypothetical protein